MFLPELIEPQAVATYVGATNKHKALQLAAEMAERLFMVDGEVAHEALAQREALGSTGVGNGVAVPHATLDGIKKTCGLFIRLETPVEFEAIDGRPVDLIFALFSPPEREKEHLQALAKISRLLRQGELRERLRQNDNEDALYAILTRFAETKAA